VQCRQLKRAAITFALLSTCGEICADQTNSLFLSLSELCKQKRIYFIFRTHKHLHFLCISSLVVQYYIERVRLFAGADTETENKHISRSITREKVFRFESKSRRLHPTLLILLRNANAASSYSSH